MATTHQREHFWHQIFRPFFGVNAYARKPLPGPGSENLAFLDLLLQEQTPIGAGQANQMQFIFTTPATYVPHVIGVNGIGGLLSGQFYGSPLNVQQPRTATPQPVVLVGGQLG
jgi:hypothetical protein